MNDRDNVFPEMKELNKLSRGILENEDTDNNNKLNQIIEDTLNDYLKTNNEHHNNKSFKLSLKNLKELINQVIEEEGYTLTKNNTSNVSVLKDNLNEGVSLKEYQKLKRQIIAILRNLPPDKRKEEVKSICSSFGFMSFKDFLQAQNNMIKSSKGDLNKDK